MPRSPAVEGQWSDEGRTMEEDTAATVRIGAVGPLRARGHERLGGVASSGRVPTETESGRMAAARRLECRSITSALCMAVAIDHRRRHPIFRLYPIGRAHTSSVLQFSVVHQHGPPPLSSSPLLLSSSLLSVPFDPPTCRPRRRVGRLSLGHSESTRALVRRLPAPRGQTVLGRSVHSRRRVGGSPAPHQLLLG